MEYVLSDGLETANRQSVKTNYVQPVKTAVSQSEETAIQQSVKINRVQSNRRVAVLKKLPSSNL